MAWIWRKPSWVPYWRRRIYLAGTGGPIPPPPSSLVLGFIGDSIWALTNAYGSRDTPTIVAAMLRKLGGIRTVTIVNRAESGTASGDWITSAGRYVTAVSDFLAASVTHVVYRLGANDAAGSVSQATYGSNMNNTFTGLLSNGFKIIPCFPPYRGDDPGFPAFLTSYQSPINSAVNGSTILQGDTLAYNWFAANASELDGAPGSGVHPGVLGSESDATMVAHAIWNQIYNTGGTGGGSVPSLRSRLLGRATN